MVATRMSCTPDSLKGGGYTADDVGDYYMGYYEGIYEFRLQLTLGLIRA